MEDEGLAEQVVERLGGRAIATAESFTAGRVAEVLACVPGAKDFLRGGLVAYQEAVKRDLLGVRAESVLSEQCAREMAAGVARLLGADVAVSTTGVAGDKPEEGRPPGSVWIGTFVGGSSAARSYRFDGSPEEVCDRARHQALIDLHAALDAAAGAGPDATPERDVPDAAV